MERLTLLVGCLILAAFPAYAGTPTGSYTDIITGGVTADSSTLQIMSNPTLSANTIYNMTTTGGAATYDIVRGVGDNIAGTTVTNQDIFGAYQIDHCPLAANPHDCSGVLYFGVDIAATNGAAVWGLNPVLSDNTTYAVSSGTGKFLQNEFDFNVTSPNTVVNGLFLIGASLSTPASSNGFRVSTLGTGIKWGNAFVVDNGAALNALVVGATATSGTNIASQAMPFSFFDSGGAAQNYAFHVNATQQFVLNSSIGAVGGATLVVNGLIRTPDTQTNAFEAGALATSGTNIASQTFLWHFFNNSGVSLFASAAVNTLQTLAFTGAAAYTFDQNVSSPLFIGNGVTGTTCSGSPTSSFAVSGGIVTHC